MNKVCLPVPIAFTFGELKVNLTKGVQLAMFWYGQYLLFSHVTLIKYTYLLTILHIRYTCSQQMSPVIAFDIALVAIYVCIMLLYNGRNAKSEKVGGRGSLVGWDGYKSS